MTTNINQFIPNSFQVANAIIDHIMRDLSDVELRCYLILIRKTTGWHKEYDFISTSQFMALAGRGKTAIIQAIRKLQELGLIVERKTQKQTKCYSLNLQKLADWQPEHEPQNTQKNTRKNLSEPVQNAHKTCSDLDQKPVQKSDPQNTIYKTHNTKNSITRDKRANQPLSEPENFDSGGHVNKAPSARKRKTDQLELLAEFDVHDQLAEDYIAHRKLKRAAISRTVLNHLKTEAAKANMTVEQAITFQMAQGWTGFFADWVFNKMGLNPSKPTPNSGVNTVHKHTNGGFQPWE